MAEAGTDASACWKSTSHGLAQHRVTGCAFDVAVITNITHEHLDFHKTYANYRAAKGRLFTSLLGLARQAGGRGQDRHPQPRRRLGLLSTSRTKLPRPKGGRAASGCGRSPPRPVSTATLPIECATDPTRHPLLPRDRGSGHQICTAATHAGRRLQRKQHAGRRGRRRGRSWASPRAEVQQGMAALAEACRAGWNAFDRGQPFTAIVDFAHTPNALARVLLTARPHCCAAGRLIAVFGCGRLARRGKTAPDGRQTAAELADLTILTAEDPRTEALADIFWKMAGAAAAAGRGGGADLLRAASIGARPCAWPSPWPSPATWCWPAARATSKAWRSAPPSTPGTTAPPCKPPSTPTCKPAPCPTSGCRRLASRGMTYVSGPASPVAPGQTGAHFIRKVSPTGENPLITGKKIYRSPHCRRWFPASPSASPSMARRHGTCGDSSSH